MLHPDTSPTQAEEIFEVDFGKSKLTLLEEFTDMRIEVLRQLNASLPSSSSGPPRGRGSSRVTDGRERWRCPICKNPHQNQKSPVRPYLSVCPVFLEMDVAGHVNACRKFGYCRICLTDSSKGHENECPKLHLFKCKHCSSPQSNSHCSLLCFKSQGTPSRQGDPPHRQDGSDGGGRGKGRGRGADGSRGRGQGGQGRGDSRRAQSDQPNRDSQSRNVQWYHLQNFDVVIKNSKNAKQPRTILQPITSCDIEVESVLHRVLCLADTGSTIGFLVRKFAEKLNIEPIGTWTGTIATLYSTQEVESNFYRLKLILSDNSHRCILALECDTLGNRPALPIWLVKNVCKEF